MYIKQTDMADSKMRGWMCLERQYMHLAEKMAGKPLSMEAILTVHNMAVKNGYVRHDKDYSCWVIDGIGVANLAADFVGIKGKFKEAGRYYYPKHFEIHPDSTRPKGMKGKRGPLLIEGRWTGKYTHFITSDFDSYYPYLPYSYVLQQRWFTYCE